MLFSKISSVLILLLFVRDFAIAVTFGRHYEVVRYVTYAAPSKDKGYLIALTDEHSENSVRKSNSFE